MGRSLRGFLNINKPKGITSFGAVEKIREIFGIRKVGHAGNLDPAATGVLVIGIAEATRFLPFIMELDKEYVAKIELGVLTDTLDSTGKILMRKPVPEFDEERLRAILRGFLGEIKQIPPFFSARKVEGKRLYELARQGVLVTLKPKKVKINSIEIVQIDSKGFTLRISCSKGAYIRSLARDIGEKLGTFGIVKELERTRVGHFLLKDSVALDSSSLKDKLISIEDGLSHLPFLVLKEKASLSFRCGSKVPPLGFLRKSKDLKSFQNVRVYDVSNNFIGIGLLKWDGLYPKRLLPEQ